MGCGCGNKRRALGGMTSAQTGAPLSPQEAAANAIANAQGLAYPAANQSTDKSGEESE